MVSSFFALESIEEVLQSHTFLRMCPDACFLLDVPQTLLHAPIVFIERQVFLLHQEWSASFQVVKKSCNCWAEAHCESSSAFGMMIFLPVIITDMQLDASPKSTKSTTRRFSRFLLWVSGGVCGEVVVSC